MKDIDVAKVCHEVNRAYCQALGDQSQVPWDEAPDWQKDSAVLGVKLHQADHEAGPQASHESWMKQKLADGWRYGEVKDAEAKTHPCIRPFAELPVEQQAKDFIFRAVVLTLSDVPIKGLNFGQAVEALKGGNKMTREGWNAPGQWVVMMPSLSLPPFNSQEPGAKVNDRTAKHIGTDTPLYSQPYFALFNAQKKWQPGWVPSTSDCLAEDWEVV